MTIRTWQTCKCHGTTCRGSFPHSEDNRMQLGHTVHAFCHMSVSPVACWRLSHIVVDSMQFAVSDQHPTKCCSRYLGKPTNVSHRSATTGDGADDLGGGKL